MDLAEPAAAARMAGKPVRKLSAGELHWLIGRQCSLPVTVPLAMERLEHDPFAQAGRHPGDLLTAVLEADRRYWLEHEEHWLAMAGILEEALRRINEHMQTQSNDYLPWHMGDDLIAAAIHFRGAYPSPAGD